MHSKNFTFSLFNILVVEFVASGRPCVLLTVNIDEHVLSRALPQAAQTGHTEQFSCMMRLGPMDGETLLDIKGDLTPVHSDFNRRELPLESHFRLR